MNLADGLVVYFLIWWVMLFAVLPWGVRREENPEPGHDPGAPMKTHLWTKVDRHDRSCRPWFGSWPGG